VDFKGETKPQNKTKQNQKKPQKTCLPVKAVKEKRTAKNCPEKSKNGKPKSPKKPKMKRTK